ncbi:MAG: glucose-1-phosphate adenylyltransferase [Chloroflexi bacterium]|nr:glucose-1-phosphate adenylyltransferase [Chloroflexota bacterium]
MQNVLTMILAGGQGERLSILAEERAKPAVPFGGKYRIIDFTLSNTVNSGLYNVAVLTQYRPRSLNEHIGSGKPWDLDRLRGGIRLLQPYLGPEADWYKGTADAVYQNLYLVEADEADTVLVLGGDHIYKMDYRDMLDFHAGRDADVTVGVMEVPLEDAHRFGIMTVNGEGRVTDFVEKPKQPKGRLVSMGIYAFKREVLIRRLNEDAAKEDSARDFGKSVIPAMVAADRVFAYRFQGYWQDVGTVQSYHEANMDLLRQPPLLDLYDPDWLIHTRSEERPPAKVTESARIVRSLICHGCVIEGTVERSILSPGVIVEPGAVVRHSVIMSDTVVRSGAVIDRCVIDKGVEIGSGARVGQGEDFTPNRNEPQRLNTGITVVGTRASIPEDTKIGRNCRIGRNVEPTDFPGAEILSGESVDHVYGRRTEDAGRKTAPTGIGVGTGGSERRQETEAPPPSAVVGPPSIREVPGGSTS